MDSVLLLSSDLLRSHLFRKKNTQAEKKKWNRKLVDLCVFLEDAETTMPSNYQTKLLVQDLELLVYDLEDSLKELTHYSLLKQPRYDPMSKKLKSFKHRIEEIYERKATLSSSTRSVQLSWQVSMPLSGEPKLYGREREKKEIIDFLFSPSDRQRRFDIIPVVGMGGSGKTTLAQHVFNDDEVVKCFEVRAWCCVSLRFDKRRVFEAIVGTVTGSCVIQDFSGIVLKLQMELKDKKFLIILDDLWNEDVQELTDFWAPFMDSAPGSKFIITTRKEKIASLVKTVERCVVLNPISDEECWSLFCVHAEIDKTRFAKYCDITKKLAGLPLAAVIMGNYMRNRKKKDWDDALSDRSWNIQSSVIDVLKRTYDNLPSSLKRCFLFCSIFPENYEYRKDDLAKIWVAADPIHFIEQHKSTKDLEDVGCMFFDELVSQNLLALSGNADQTYVMHPLIRSMAKEVRSNLYCRLENVNMTLQNPKHLAVSKKVFAATVDSLGSGEIDVAGLRTFLQVDDENDRSENIDLVKMFIKAQKLRVLCIHNLKTLNLPNSIGKMTYLRYIGIRGCGLTTLPKKIGQLTNLSYFDLSGCSRLSCLPPEIGRLVNLSQLDMRSCSQLKSIPVEIGMLTNLSYLNLSNCQLTVVPHQVGYLQNLSHFNISGFLGTCLPPEIGKLTNLSILEMSNCRNLKHLPCEIGNLVNLTSLDLRWCSELLTLPEEMNKLVKLSRIKLDGRKELPAWAAKRKLMLEDCSKHELEWDCLGDENMSLLISQESTTSELKKHEALSETPVRTKLMGPQCVEDRSEDLKSGFHMKDDAIHELPITCDSSEEITKAGTTMGEKKKIVGETTPEHSDEIIQRDPENLIQLDLSRTEISILPEYVFRLQNLESLILKNCLLLKELPVDIDKLRHLKLLDLSGALIQSLPESLAHLNNLETLILKDCSQLEKLPSVIEVLGRLGLDITGCAKLKSLVIHDIQKVTSDPKPDLLSKYSSFPNLKLIGGPQNDSKSPQLSSSKKESNVLKQLLPHDNLEKLTICGYDGLHFPYWLEKASFYLRKLINLKLKNCFNCYSLVLQDTMPSLRNLVISNCPMLNVTLPNLPSLEYLELKNCYGVECVKEFSLNYVEKVAISSLQRIGNNFSEKIIMSRHAEVLEIPRHYYFPGHGGDEERKIEYYEVKEDSTLKHLPNWVCSSKDIKSLRIESCPALETLSPSGNLPSTLSSIQIVECKELTSISRQGTLPACLRKIVLHHCPKLEIIAEEMPAGLQSLEIGYCPSIKTLPRSYSLSSLRITSSSLEILNLLSVDKRTCKYTNLTELDLTKFPSYISFPPKELRMLCSLKSLTCLTLDGFPDLKRLSQSHFLSSLTDLSIGNCPVLQSIPKEWLPPSLQGLYIWNCPMLRHKLGTLQKLIRSKKRNNFVFQMDGVLQNF